MDLRDQLKQLFPDHIESDFPSEDESSFSHQSSPLLLKYEKKGRNGKPVIIVSGFEGDETELKKLATQIKQKFAVGGSIKDNEIILQGDIRDKLTPFLNTLGFKTKRVGG